MLAIIPARKNSKGLKDKNIKLINGKPLIAYTIEAAIKSKYIYKVFISTDYERIIKIASKYKIKIPFLRPKRFATDKSPAIKTYLYTVQKLNKVNPTKVKNFIVLLPTSPLRNFHDIDNSIKLFYKKKADSVVSMCKSHQPIEWQKYLSQQKRIGPIFNKKKSIYNRQLLTPTYVPNGSIYVFKYECLKKNLNYYSKNSFAYLMPKIRSYDIDDKIDFEIIKNFLKKNNRKKFIL